MPRKVKVFQAFLMFALAAALISGPARAEDKKAPLVRHVHIRLIPERTRIAAGGKVTVAIEQTIDAGWHTYWINPGDSGEPPEIKWTLPEGFTADDAQFPPPEKIITGPLASYGYEQGVTLLQDIHAGDKVPDGPLKLTATIDVLVCKDICIPETGTYDLTLNGAGQMENISSLAGNVRRTLPEPFTGAATFHEADGNFVLNMRIPNVDESAPVMFAPVDWGVLDNPSRAKADYKNGTITQKRGDRPIDKLGKIRLLVEYADKYGAGKALLVEAEPGKLKTAAAAAPAVTAKKAGPKNQTSFLQAVVFALLGGLVLNLMPCVFPVLSLKTLKLCKLSGRELGEARAHSLFYTGGILASFGGLAIALIVLRGAGQQIGWGFQLQNPAFVLPLSWLLFVIGLNLSGFFEFGGGLANLGHKLTEGHSLAASFFTGVLAAVVATPCTAPFMGVALGYALTQPAPVTLIVLLALGFGLALPFLLISYIPALRALLPKPGLWMQTFKEFLAFPMFASAAWLAWVFSLQSGPMGIPVALSGVVAIAFGLWLLKKGSGNIVVRALAAVSFIVAAALVPVGGKMQAQTTQVMAMGGDWEPFVAADLDKLLQGAEPVFVDMTAAWCITCKVNENAVLNTAGITDLFHKKKIQTIRGDWTNQNPEITAFLAKFGRNGVPIYVYYGPRNAGTHERPEPVVLPQLLTVGIVENAVEGK